MSPRKPSRLAFQAFAAIVIVAIGASLAVGLFTSYAFTSAFTAYRAALPERAPGMGMGRQMILSAADQTFQASVSRGVLLGVAVAVVVAAISAIVLTRLLIRPLRRLEEGARQLGAGELGHRVPVEGPAEIASLGEEFNRMAETLEEQEQLRQRLVADVAHELRNPIAAARAQAEGMAEGVLETTPERVASLVEDLTHLGRLVADLQELSSADAGRLSYELGPLDAAALTAREAERAAAGAPARVAVTADVSAAAGAVVLGDEQRLSQVLRNLLGNALRHTAQGSVTAVVTRAGQWVEFRVDDTGEGIPEPDLPNVFERFYRADAARAADTGGAGLGLAIARRIVEDHGGTVFAANREGGGASVGFRLPLHDE